MRFDLYFLEDSDPPAVKQMDVVAKSPEDALAQFRAFQHWNKKQKLTVRFVLLERVYTKERAPDALPTTSLTDLLASEDIDTAVAPAEGGMGLQDRLWLLVHADDGETMLRDPRTGKCYTLARMTRRHAYHVRVLNAADGQVLGFLFAASETNAKARIRSLRRHVTREKLAPVRTVIVARSPRPRQEVPDASTV